MPSFEGFTLLDSKHPGRRSFWASMGLGVLLQAFGLGLLFVLTLLFPQRIEKFRQDEVLMVSLPKFSEPQHVSYLPPPRVKQEAEIPQPVRVDAPARHLSPKLTEVPKVEKSAASSMPSVSPQPIPPQPLPPVKNNDQGGSSETASLRLPNHAVQTGGFGSPNGFAGPSHHNGNTVAVGLFGMPDGAGKGNGTSGSKRLAGTVASAGFGDGVAVSTAHGTRETVASSGFGDGVARVSDNADGRGRSVKPASGFDLVPATETREEKIGSAPPPMEPVVILSKPNPRYTDEARRLRIEGEVALSVVFEAAGHVRVLGVVRGLGHGLDESAKQAAEQIRFKAAMQGGQTVDFPATVRIVFELAS